MSIQITLYYFITFSQQHTCSSFSIDSITCSLGSGSRRFEVSTLRIGAGNRLAATAVSSRYVAGFCIFEEARRTSVDCDLLGAAFGAVSGVDVVSRAGVTSTVDGVIAGLLLEA